MASAKVQAVREYAESHPDDSYKEIVQATGTSAATVSRALAGWEPDEVRERRLRRGRHVVDESGKRYGHLTVVRYVAGSGWACRCDCGREVTVSGHSLRLGHVTRCGQCSDVQEGQRFGALVTVRRVGEGTGGGRLSLRWLCRCDCGREVEMAESALVRGDKTSCGCRAEMMRRQAETSGRTDGTKLSSLTASLSKANRTGVKGVYESRGRYVATIKLRGKSYSLGTFGSLEGARAARERAEQELFAPILEEHGRSLG